MAFSIPGWMKELTDQVNKTGGEGVPGLLRHFQLFNHIGLMVDKGSFLSDLTSLVEGYGGTERGSQTRDERLKTLQCPDFVGKNWRAELHVWTKEVMNAFLGFHVEVPEPPDLDQNQRGLLKKYGFKLFFVPAIFERQFPSHMVMLDSTRFLRLDVTAQVLPLPGKWVAFETIRKPNCQEGRYPDDQLMEDIRVETRFNHPYSGKGGGDDLVGHILPKVANVLGMESSWIQLPSAEIWNFLGNFMNWLRENTGETLQDLGSTNSWEWCFNSCGLGGFLIVGSCLHDGLADVNFHWGHLRDEYIGFRVLAVLS